MTTLATPAPILATTIDAPTTETIDTDAAEQSPWFRGWAVAGAILAMVDITLAALAMVIL